MTFSGFATDLKRKQARAFIQQNPSEVILNRSTKEDDGAGGVSTSSVDPVYPQTMRIFESGEVETITTPAGSIEDLSWFLYGMTDADVKVGDTFTVEIAGENRTFIVMTTRRNDERVRCGCMEVS